MTTPPFSSLQELFADERRWCQRHFRRPADADNPEAFCLVGALNYLYPGEESVQLQLRQALHDDTWDVYDPTESLLLYNDAPTRTIADIQALVKLANV